MSEQAEQDDRTEEPTAKRLEEAIKKGDVAKSAELNTRSCSAASPSG